MKKELVKGVWEILRKYVSDEIIISSTKNPKEYSNIEKLEQYYFEYFLNEETPLQERETKLARWLEKFLSNIKFFNNNLNKFSDFYNEINLILLRNNFEISRNDYRDNNYNIYTQEEVKRNEKLLEDHFRSSEEHAKDFIKEEEAIEKERENQIKTILKDNQNLLNSFLKDSTTYIKILKIHLQQPEEIDVVLEKDFIKSIKGMKESVKKLQMFITDRNLYNFNTIVPFDSLYTMKERWEEVLIKDRTSEFHSSIIKNQNLDFDNIKSLLGPILSYISSFVDTEILDYTENKEETYIDKKLEKINKSKNILKKYNPIKPTFFTEDKEVQHSYEKLSSWTDGTITYNNSPLDARNQIKDLCMLFLERPETLITYDDIKDNIFGTKKALLNEDDTILKYVSLLRKELKKHTETLEIKNTARVGYKMIITK